jgi:hypothetical protein
MAIASSGTGALGECARPMLRCFIAVSKSVYFEVQMGLQVFRR